MGYHGRARISSRRPEAKAICDRCGFTYSHTDLSWQFQWSGPKLQNLRLLVCKSCLDVPQEQLRTIILPPDPVPIQNPRSEQYAPDNNPNSPIGQAAIASMTGTNIGTLIGGGGTYAAFDGNVNKPFMMCANLGVPSQSGFDWVGKDWNAEPAGASPAVTGMSTAVRTLMALGFTATAPRDAAFIGSSMTTTYGFQGSSDGSNWTDLMTPTTTVGTHGETITVTSLSGGTPYQYHRFIILNDLVNPVGVAQLSIDTDRGITGIL